MSNKQIIHLVHIPKTAGSSLLADLWAKMSKNNGCLIDLYQVTRQNCRALTPHLDVTKEYWSSGEIQSARELTLNMKDAVTESFFNRGVGQYHEKLEGKNLIVHYHISGNTKLIKCASLQTDQSRKHSILFSLRDPLKRTRSHFNALNRAIKNCRNVKLWDAMFDNGLLNGELINYKDIDAINSGLSSAGESFEITQNEINSMKFLKLYQIRWLLSYILCKTSEDRDKIIFEMEPAQVESLFLKNSHKLDTKEMFHYSYLNSDGALILNESFYDILDSIGCEGYTLDFHHPMTKASKGDLDNSWSEGLSSDLLYWLDREEKLLSTILPADMKTASLGLDVFDELQNEMMSEISFQI